jgi:predicted exporter
MSDDRSAGRPLSKGILLCLLVLTAASVAGFFRLRIDSSLEPLLPEKSEARRTVLFLRDSSFAAKAVLWFRLTGPGSTSDLIAAADETEKRIDPTLIKQVIHPPREADAFDQAFALMDHAGELLNQNDLAELDKATAPDALNKRMREVYLQLTKPEGSFMVPMIRRDPLGISSRILTRLLALTNGLGYKVEVKDGHLLSPDGRQLIMILETSSTATSLASSETLVAHLNALCAAAPPGVQIIPICGQIHTEQNSQLMQSDMNRAGLIDGIAFLLLFLIVCRDWRVAAVFLLPIVTIALTIGLCALFFPNLSTIVIGLAATMAGSAVDYGIFVYTAVWLGNDPTADVRRIQRPLIICNLTTLGVFVALLFSHIPAYRQLGYLTSVSLLLSLLGALYVLPALIKPGGKVMPLPHAMPLRRWGRMMVPIALIGVVLFVGACVVAGRIKFDPDISQLDGVSAAVKQNEADFQRAWSRTNADQALLVVSAPTQDAAEQANDQVYRLIGDHLPDGQFVSLSGVWPSAAIRAGNERRWRAFWSAQRIAALRRDLATAGAPYGFAADAFNPFFDTLTNPPPADGANQIIAAIEPQFIATGNGDYQMLSFFDDTADNIAAVRKMITERPDAQIVSRRALGQAFAASAVSETRLLVGLSAAFIIVSLLLLTRSTVKSVIIMLPAIAGVIFMLALLTTLSLSISVVSVVVAILVMALASDYGVFSAYAWDGNESLLGQGMASMHLSSLTTLAGAGALIFARHPALHLVGVSMTSGILAGYLTAFVAIPTACYLLDKHRIRKAQTP